MKISAKSRYALAAAICLAESYSTGEYLAVLSISDRLGISKIYLEQVFSLLKRGEIVQAVKGAQGGYLLSKKPADITVYELLAAIEIGIFEETSETVKEKAPNIERALFETVFTPFDAAIAEFLKSITLETLTANAQSNEAMMFYI